MDLTMDNVTTASLHCKHTNCKMGTLAVARYVMKNAIMTPTRERDLVMAACRGGHVDTLAYLGPLAAAAFCEYGLRAACKGGHLLIMGMMAAHGAHDWHGAMIGACEGGHLPVVKFVAERLTSYHYAQTYLRHACTSGHVAIVEYILSLGGDATDWIAMANACASGNADLVELLTRHGNTSWDDGMRGAIDGGHLPLVKIMAARGATCWDMCLRTATGNDHIRVVQYLISCGATDISRALAIAKSEGYLRMALYLMTILPPPV
jgi:hypothetical protein